MTSTTRIPPAELTGLYGAVVKRMSRKLFGEVPEPVGVACLLIEGERITRIYAMRNPQKLTRLDEVAELHR